MRNILAITFVVLFIVATETKWQMNHDIRGDASHTLSKAIKDHILANIHKISNTNVANQLKNDLNVKEDAKRKLKELDNTSANELFSIFKLKDPGCDKNHDGKVSGDELKCLGKLYKAYLPPDAEHKLSDHAPVTPVAQSGAESGAGGAESGAGGAESGAGGAESGAEGAGEEGY